MSVAAPWALIVLHTDSGLVDVELYRSRDDAVCRGTALQVQFPGLRCVLRRRWLR